MDDQSRGQNEDGLPGRNMPWENAGDRVKNQIIAEEQFVWKMQRSWIEKLNEKGNRDLSHEVFTTAFGV